MTLSQGIRNSHIRKSKLYTSDKDKSNALNKFFSSVFTTEDPTTAPNFYVDKNDDISLPSITIDPSILFEY